jgi:hypothetical protein
MEHQQYTCGINPLAGPTPQVQGLTTEELDEGMRRINQACLDRGLKQEDLDLLNGQSNAYFVLGF